MTISVLVLTKNEAGDIIACLQSVSWSDDVHVLDSGSTDATVELAEGAGAHVSFRSFDGYASQRNAGLALSFRHDWLLILDADERVPVGLMMEMQDFVATVPAEVAAARMRRRDIWRRRWLKHAQISPWFVRLVRVGKVHYEREINEVLVVDGEVQDLVESFDHYPFSKGLSHWIGKHNQYSSMEAELIVSGSILLPSWRTAFWGSDFNERRVHQKAIFYSLPARPLVKFFYMLLVRRAFLDGAPGIAYAFLQSIYEYFIVLKVQEIRSSRLGA